MNSDKILLVFLLATFCYSVATAMEKSSTARINEVARLGKQVMPFDLNRTLHIFSKTEHGGVQQVISKDSDNLEQVTLIREHLSKIAADFKLADFTDPEKIHGKDMPGLEALRNAKPKDLSILYREIADGAEITYTSEDVTIIHAIHQWFDAQLNDHARHAVMHRQHHGMNSGE